MGETAERRGDENDLMLWRPPQVEPSQAACAWHRGAKRVKIFSQAFTLLSIIAHVKGDGCFLGPRRTSSKKCCHPSTEYGLQAAPQTQPLKDRKSFTATGRLMCLRISKTEGTRRCAALPSARRDFFFTSTSSASSSTKFMNSSNPW